MNKSNIFWVGYSDLLTSLFFVMLVLFGITFIILKKKNNELKASAEQLDQIKQIEQALGSLDPAYFLFDNENKRYRMNIEVNFPPNVSNMSYLNPTTKSELKAAGLNLYDKINALIKENSKIEYLLIVEGHTQKANGNWVKTPDLGYKLSYERALSLINFWKNDCNIPFDNIKENCELLIVGSGYFGQSRDSLNEKNNRRFTIQVTSKVGKFLEEEASRVPIIKKIVEIQGEINTIQETSVDWQKNYDSVGGFSNGILAEVEKNGKFGYVNKAGNEIIPVIYDLIEPSDPGGPFIVQNNHRFGVIDVNGKLIVPLNYDNIQPQPNSLMVIIMESKLGLINKYGEEITPIKYDGIGSWGDGLAFVISDGKCGYINAAGEEVVPLVYDKCESFNSGKAMVSFKGNTIYINTNGEDIEDGSNNFN